MAEEQKCKTPTIKRQTSNRGRKKKVKKITGNEAEVEADSDNSGVDEPAHGSESESSDSMKSIAVRRSEGTAYTLDKLKPFLQTTKGMKGVKVVEFFPDRQKFLDSARILMRETGDGGFTDPKIFRLNKMHKIKLNLLNEEFEVA